MFHKSILRFSLIAGVCLFLGCIHSARQSDSRSQAMGSENNEVLRTIASSSADPSFDNLVDLIRDEKISKIGDLLGRLSTLYPAYLTHHTLSYESLSLQDGSYVHPRAIVFGESARMVISFNGDSNQRGYSGLETMTFSEKKGYQFREIVFAGEPQAEATAEEQEEAKNIVDLQLPRATVSQSNPGKCLQCHSSENPRPIWQPYFIWPGMYGSDDDNLFRGPSFPAQSIQRLADAGKHFVDTEQLGFQKYWNQRADHDRYRYLSKPTGGRSIFKPEYGPDQKMETRPNATLLLLFSDQIARLMVEDISHRPNTLRNLALLAAVKCYDESYFGRELPPALQPILDKARSLEESYKRAALEVLIEDISREQRNFLGTLTFKDDVKNSRPDEDDPFGPKKKRVRVPAVVSGLRSTPVSDIVAGVYNELFDDKAFFYGNERGVRSTQIATALQGMGIDINRYSIGLRRTNDFEDGAKGPRILDPIRDKIQELRRLSTRPNCQDIAALLDRMKN
jgi:hypothetical protein